MLFLCLLHYDFMIQGGGDENRREKEEEKEKKQQQRAEEGEGRGQTCSPLPVAHCCLLSDLFFLFLCTYFYFR